MLKDLIELCKVKFRSYNNLAKKLGVSPSYISEWKSGVRNPTPAQIVQMAEFIGYEPVQVLFYVMEEIDSKNADLWKKWRPYGDSNPGYRRERAMSQSPNFIQYFCKVILTWAGILTHRVNFQGRGANIAGLFEYRNVLAELKRGKAVHLALPRN